MTPTVPSPTVIVGGMSNGPGANRSDSRSPYASYRWTLRYTPSQLAVSVDEHDAVARAPSSVTLQSDACRDGDAVASRGPTHPGDERPVHGLGRSRSTPRGSKYDVYSGSTTRSAPSSAPRSTAARASARHASASATAATCASETRTVSRRRGPASGPGRRRPGHPGAIRHNLLDRDVARLTRRLGALLESQPAHAPVHREPAEDAHDRDEKDLQEADQARRHVVLVEVAAQHVGR